MSKAFQDNGCYRIDGSLSDVHDTIDSTIRKLYNDLLAQGYELNEILALLTLSACDTRAEIAIDNRFKERPRP